MINYLLTCHTNGCENENIAIPLAVPEDIEQFFCGACSQSITDRVIADGM